MKKISNQPDKPIMDGMWTTLINTAPKQCMKKYIYLASQKPEVQIS